MMGRAKQYEPYILVGIVLVVTALAVVAHRRARRRAEIEEAEQAAQHATAALELTSQDTTAPPR